MDDNAVSRIDALIVYTPEEKARKLISTYDVGEILTNSPDLYDKIYYDGKLSSLEHGTVSLSTLTVAAQSDFCQIIFDGKTTLLCLGEPSLPDGYGCERIICDERYKDLINPDNFNEIIYAKADGEAVKVVLS